MRLVQRLSVTFHIPSGSFFGHVPRKLLEIFLREICLFLFLILRIFLLDLLLIITQIVPGMKLRCKCHKGRNHISSTILCVIYESTSLIDNRLLESVVLDDHVITCLLDHLKKLSIGLSLVLKVRLNYFLEDEEWYSEVLS